jgi:hypothetical protein
MRNFSKVIYFLTLIGVLFGILSFIDGNLSKSVTLLFILENGLLAFSGYFYFQRQDKVVVPSEEITPELIKKLNLSLDTFLEIQADISEKTELYRELQRELQEKLIAIQKQNDSAENKILRKSKFSTK